MEFLSVLFASEMYSLGSDSCVPIKGTNIQQLNAKCGNLFGYQPTYLELIKPKHGSVSLYDQLIVDFCYLNKYCGKVSLIEQTLYGACQVRNDTGHQFTLRHINDSLAAFPLENLAHTVMVNQSDMSQVDFISSNLNSMTHRTACVICVTE